MQYPVGTKVKFCGLVATVVTNYPKGSPGATFEKTRIQYEASGNRETVASDTLVLFDDSPDNDDNDDAARLIALRWNEY